MSELIQGVYKQSGQPDQLVPVQVDADGRIATTSTATISSEIEIKNDTGNPISVSVASGITTTSLLSGFTTVSAGPAVANIAKEKTYQVYGLTTADTGSATVQVQGSNDGVHWDNLLITPFQLNLSTAHISDSFASNDRYAFIRGNVTAIAGTGASVNLTMGG